MMLSKREKEGCFAILHQLPDDEVMALAQTTTAHQIVLSNRKEAVDAVIMFTTDAVDLLKRKKMKRDYLFQYLAQNKIPISPTADKNQLSLAILKMWGSHIPQEGLAFMEDSTSVPQPDSEEQKLSVAFANWFYKVLNAQNPLCPSADTEEFGSQHFYTDCKLCLLVICPTSDTTRMEYEGGDLVSQRLLALVREEQILFHPNLCPEGTQGRSDPHGLTHIIVCGSVHQRDRAIGIFQQQFGLIQEPITNSWKIKYSNLKIGTQSSQETPSLQHTKNVLGIEA